MIQPNQQSLLRVILVVWGCDMEITIIDTNFNLITKTKHILSLQNERKLWEVGNVELHISMKEKNAFDIQTNHIFYIDNKRAGIIETIDKDEVKNELIATGYQLKGIVKRRITVPTHKSETTFFGWDRFPDVDDPDSPAESVIKHYIDTHMVNSEDESRKFPNLIIAPNLQRGTPMRWQSRFEPLDEVLREIGEWCGMGYDIYLDFENKKFVFDVIDQVNRTAEEVVG